MREGDALDRSRSSDHHEPKRRRVNRETQERYAAGVRDSLVSFFEDRPIRDDYVMVSDGEIQSGSYKAIYG